MILKGIDPFKKSLENVTSISSIETEINSDNCTIIRLRHNLIVITPNFLLKLGAFRAHTVAIRDIILPERPSYIRTWVDGERVDVVNLKIVSRRFFNATFHISILREQYRQLESFVGRIRSAQAAIAKTAVLDLSDSIRAGVETSTGRGNSSNNDKCINRVPGCLRTQRECKNCQAMSKLYGTRTVSLCTELVSSMYFEMVDQSKPNQT